MSKIIAVTGKGGTGKTTVAALIIRALLERKRGSVLAVDADPNATLAEALALGPAAEALNGGFSRRLTPLNQLGITPFSERKIRNA